MKVTALKLAASFVSVAALTVVGASTALAEHGGQVTAAPMRSLSDHVNPPVIRDTVSIVSREDEGIDFYVHTALDQAATPAGHPARIDAYVVNHPEACANAGAPYAQCSGGQLARGIGDSHVLTGVRYAYANDEGRLNVRGNIPVGAALTNPKQAELWLVVRTYSSGHYQAVQISFQDPKVKHGNTHSDD